MTSSSHSAAKSCQAMCQTAAASWIAGVALWLTAIALLITIR